MKATVQEIIDASKTNQRIEGTFVISKCDLKSFLNKPGSFLSCELTDKTGSIRGVVWDDALAIKQLITDKMVVDVTGEATRYKDIPQVTLSSVKKAETYNPGDFVPELDQAVLKHYLDQLGRTKTVIVNEVCKKIWDYIIPAKNDFGRAFISCPGGVGSVHHAYVGGLVEHVAGMIIASPQVIKQFKLDQDLVVTGCLIHDIGKVPAYNWNVVIEMSDRGRLLHHIPIGFGLLKEIAQTLGINPEDETLTRLLHIIVSHHEDEGHRKPMFPEAQAVSMLDAMDAALNFCNGFIKSPENQEEGNWTKFCRLTERQYYNPTPKGE